MSAYEDLLDRISVIPEPCLTRAECALILAEVLRELEAWAGSNITIYDEDMLRTMLRTSPLMPPEDKW